MGGCSCGKVFGVLNILCAVAFVAAAALMLLNAFNVLAGNFLVAIGILIYAILLLVLAIFLLIHEFKAVDWISSHFKAYDTLWGRGCIYIFLGASSLSGFGGWLPFLLGLYYVIAVLIKALPRPEPCPDGGGKIADEPFPCCGCTCCGGGNSVAPRGGTEDAAEEEA